MPTILICATNTEISSCFPVMHELRPLLEEAAFIPRIREQIRGGYRLAYLEDAGEIRAVAGYRFMQTLVWSHLMYVDDLVTREVDRGKGYGGILLEWLKAHARESGCDQFHLDSGTHRLDAHRFYKQHGMDISSYHFSMSL